MPRKRKPRVKHQGIDFVIGGLRKLVRDPKSSPAMRLKALDRLSLIDDIYSVKLIDAEDVTSQPDAKIESLDDRAEKMVASVTNKAREEKKNVPTGNEGTNESVRTSVG